MKWFCSVLTVVCLTIAHTGCNGTTESNNGATPTEETEATTEAEDTTETESEMPPIGPSGGKMDQDPTPSSTESEEEATDVEGDDTSAP